MTFKQSVEQSRMARPGVSRREMLVGLGGLAIGAGAGNWFVARRNRLEAVGSAATAQQLSPHTLGVLGAGTQVRLQSGPSGARAILVAGRPLREPVARYGPFVMNTQEQLRQAFDDYQRDRF